MREVVIAKISEVDAREMNASCTFVPYGVRIVAAWKTKTRTGEQFLALLDSHSGAGLTEGIRHMNALVPSSTTVSREDVQFLSGSRSVPRVTQPQEGLENLSAVSWEFAEVSADDRTLWIHYNTSTERILASAHVRNSILPCALRSCRAQKEAMMVRLIPQSTWQFEVAQK
jgi:hypothetical protein